MPAPGIVVSDVSSPNISNPPNPPLTPGTTARRLLVRCPRIADAYAIVRTSDPLGAVIGNVLLLGGGQGREAWTLDPEGTMFAQELLGAGYRVMELFWPAVYGTLGGWWASSGSILAGAQRTSTVAFWLRAQISEQLCLLGNSGGAGAWGYLLARHGGDGQANRVVCASGPVFSRLDVACISLPQWWQDQGQALLGAQGLSSPPYELTGQPGSLFCQATAGRPSGFLYEDSILYSAALSYPQTVVRVVLGLQDFSAAVPFGLLFADAIAAPVVMAAAPHYIADTPDGRAALLAAVSGT